MMESKKYYRDLDVIRSLSCIGVLLYHLNILKGGYLAVCIFFVLTGYLSFISAYKKDKLSLKEYYKNKLMHIYLPLVIVVFLSVFVIGLIPSIHWINLKPETTSVLFGYNNYWQIGAKLDYFAGHVSSPFMHFWFIAILLQFDFIFPFVFILLKKIGDKTKKYIPFIITLVLTVSSAAYFYYRSTAGNIMSVYYDTFCRIFSICLGIALGVVSADHQKGIPDKLTKPPYNRIIFYIYILLIIASFVFIDSASKMFAFMMILTSIIACRAICYGTLIIKDKLNIFDQLIKFFAGISYEIYLVQYPIIFIFQTIELNIYLKTFLIIILSIFSAYLIHYSLSMKKTEKKPVFKFICLFIIGCLSLIGVYDYISAKDYTEEMKQLEEQMSANREMMADKQKAYLKAREKADNEFKNALDDLNKSEEALADDVKSMPVVGVGDSVMLGALNSLYRTFPNGYFDADISRTDYEANGILNNLKNKGILGDPIIINLGTNGQCGESCRLNILQTCGNRQIFWVNVTNDSDVHVNADLAGFAERNSNVHLIDWYHSSLGHTDWFLADGIHLTLVGTENYSRILFEYIYNYYLEEYHNKKQKLLEEYENQTMNKITFYGSSILINAYENIQNNFKDANYNLSEEYDFNRLVTKIESDRDHNYLTNKVVLIFDNDLGINNDEYNKIIQLIGDRKIYIVNIAKEEIVSQHDNVTVIDFYKETEDHKNYLMADKVHLSKEGNAALSEIISDTINK